MDSDADENVCEAPSFEPENVVSILVSASFLKMGPLVDMALKYVHRNMNKILTTTHNLNCLGDPLVSRYWFDFEYYIEKMTIIFIDNIE